MGFEIQPIRPVHNHYGTRDTVSGAGSFTTNGPDRTYEFTIDETALTEFLPEVTIYKGERITSATVTGLDQFATTGGTFDITLTRLDNQAETDYTILETELEVAPDVAVAVASMASVTAVTAADSLVSITGVAGTFGTYGKVKIHIETGRVVEP